MDPKEFKGRMDVLKSLILIEAKKFPAVKAVQVKKYEFGIDASKGRLHELKYVPYGMKHRMVSIDLTPYEDKLKDKIIVKALVSMAKQRQGIVEVKAEEMA